MTKSASQIPLPQVSDSNVKQSQINIDLQSNVDMGIVDSVMKLLPAHLEISSKVHMKHNVERECEKVVREKAKRDRWTHSKKEWKERNHHRNRESLDALQVDDFPRPPVECLETLDVGEFKELLKTYSPSTYWTSWNEVRCLRRA